MESKVISLIYNLWNESQYHGVNIHEVASSKTNTFASVIRCSRVEDSYWFPCIQYRHLIPALNEWSAQG